jgi:cytochrome d ubiquinol oxidase subunit I
VAQLQPEKFAAIQGLYTTQSGAPLAVFAVPVLPPPQLKAKIEIPSLLSYLAFGDANAKVKGINEFPRENIPPLFLTFVSYHNMVLLGILFILLTVLGTIQLYRNKLWESRKLLKLFIWAIPFPVFACELGWISAEVGRQPWIVYNVMRTADAVSTSVVPGDVLFSIIMFGLIYLLLGCLFIYLLVKEIKHGPETLLHRVENAAKKEVL